MPEMAATQKITVEVPTDLLQRARSATGTGVSETVREGLQELVARRAQLGVLKLRGRVKFSKTWQELKDAR
jgi:post-segregation antitoxin (ccd killing protein)